MTALVPNMPEAEYHAHPAISKSGLDLIRKSPAHYKAGFKTATDAMRMGSAIHCLILEPDSFSDRYTVCTAKDRRQAEYKELVQQVGEEWILMKPEAERCQAVAEAVRADPLAHPMVSAAGLRELSVFAKDPETGVEVRCRFDLLADSGFALDLKKARDATSYGFTKSVAAYRYHVQAAFYSDVLEWATGETVGDFWFLAVEDAEPFTVCRYRLDDQAIAIGRKEYREDLRVYAHCLETDTWPKYQPEHEWISLPEWKLAEHDEELELT